ncbi:MAG: hypothetical protein ACYTHJ_07390 [Planctomycetota bacterium]|jgi:hypothetical protein
MIENRNTDEPNEQPKKEGPVSNGSRFDPTELRLGQDFGAELGLKKALVTVPVRKPDKQWFVRVHPSEEFRLTTAVLELKEDREVYLVDKDLREELAGEVVVVRLFTAINRQGVLFLRPIRLPGVDGKHNEWHRTQLVAAEAAMENWTRVQANMSLGAYEYSIATGPLDDPSWPEKSLQQVLEIAFGDRFIADITHPAVRRLRGAI